MRFSVNCYHCLVVFGSAFLVWFPNTTSNAFLTATTNWNSVTSRTGTFFVPVPAPLPSVFAKGGDDVVRASYSGGRSLHELSMEQNRRKTRSSAEKSGRTSRKERLVDAMRKKSVESDVNQYLDVSDSDPTIDDFIYSEALLYQLQVADADEKRAFKTARQAALDFISDVNDLQIKSESDYLLKGSVTFPNSNKILQRDDESTQNFLSNKGLALLLEASINEMSVITSSFGPKSFTKYKQTNRVSKANFNKTTIFGILNTLLTGFNEGAAAGIQSAAEALGTNINTSVEEENGNEAVTLNTFVAIDYDAVFDEVIASFETILFDFNLNAWSKIEETKNSKSVEENVDMTTEITSIRSGVNLNRLVKYYKLNQNDGSGDENPVGPGGKTTTVIAYGEQLKPLPKADKEFVSQIRTRIYKEYGFRVTRRLKDKTIPGSNRMPGLKVNRSNKKDC